MSEVARRLEFTSQAPIAVDGETSSVFYAAHWLNSIGLESGPLDATHDPQVAIVGGDDPTAAQRLKESGLPAPTTIVLWDFQVSLPGSGIHAAAAAGVSWVIGHRDGLPLALPVDVPEKWCGLIGANLAIAALLDTGDAARPPRRFDASAADALRAIADQNAGNHVEVDEGWGRNGSVSVEHGGIFPQGYFPCRDGHVALVGRSRRDWQAIRAVVGDPPWSQEARFDDPFVLASDSAEAEALLSEALSQFDRDELLERALSTGATLAPVYEAEELAARGIVRSGLFGDDGSPGLPFQIHQTEG